MKVKRKEELKQMSKESIDDLLLKAKKRYEDRVAKLEAEKVRKKDATVRPYLTKVKILVGAMALKKNPVKDIEEMIKGLGDFDRGYMAHFRWLWDAATPRPEKITKYVHQDKPAKKNA